MSGNEHSHAGAFNILYSRSSNSSWKINPARKAKGLLRPISITSSEIWSALDDKRPDEERAGKLSEGKDIKTTSIFDRALFLDESPEKEAAKNLRSCFIDLRGIAYGDEEFEEVKEREKIVKSSHNAVFKIQNFAEYAGKLEEIIESIQEANHPALGETTKVLEAELKTLQ